MLCASVGILFFAGCQTVVLIPPERTAIFPVELTPQLLLICDELPRGVSESIFWTPKETDLVDLDTRLPAYLKKTMLVMAENSDRGLPLWERYCRQVGGIVVNGKRMILVSYARFDHLFGLEADPEWWRKGVVAVNDGGSDYFRVIYDPSTRQFIWYDQNWTA